MIAVFFLISISCNNGRKEWEIVKQTENVQELENYLIDFPKSVRYDSALLKLGKLIYRKSLNSKSKPGTFEEYENFVINYPRITELVNAEAKIQYLKLKADTIEIYGRVDNPFNNIYNVMLYLVNEEGKGIIEFDEGYLVNPSSNTNSDGEFLLKGHRSILLENNTFTLELSLGGYQGFITSDIGAPLFFVIDTNSRVIDVGAIKAKY
jgi:hypothetical protein